LTLPPRYVPVSPVVQIAQHGLTQQPICTRLITPALPAQPGDNIGVQAKSELLLQGPVKGLIG
jgi:hypothetical protein